MATSDPSRPRGNGALRAVLFDAGNTLIYMPRSPEKILQDLFSQLGICISLDEARAAGHESELYYVEHYLGYNGDQGDFWHKYHGAALRYLGVDDPDGEKARFLSHGVGRAGVWQPYPEAAAACESLRAMGLKLGVVSNGPVTVRDLLHHAGLLPFFEVVITSQDMGVEKPDPRIFQAALDALGLQVGEALFVGDLYDVDVLGARALGLEAALIDHDGSDAGRRDCTVLRSLEEVVSLVSRDRNRMHRIRTDRQDRTN